MTRYIVLFPEGEDRFEQMTPEQKAAGYEAHGKFAALLAERGHKITGGAQLQHSRTATTIRKSGGEVEVTDGPYAEATEHLTGFYAVETDDPADLAECCRLLAEHDSVLELRPVMESEG